MVLLFWSLACCLPLRRLCTAAETQQCDAMLRSSLMSYTHAQTHALNHAHATPDRSLSLSPRTPIEYQLSEISDSVVEALPSDHHISRRPFIDAASITSIPFSDQSSRRHRPAIIGHGAPARLPQPLLDALQVIQQPQVRVLPRAARAPSSARLGSIRRRLLLGLLLPPALLHGQLAVEPCPHARARARWTSQSTALKSEVGPVRAALVRG